MPIIGTLGVELTAELIASEALPIRCRSFFWGSSTGVLGELAYNGHCAYWSMYLLWG